MISGMGLLEGRVAVITGAGRGIGREHALLFAAEGAKVVVNDVDSGPDGSGEGGGAAARVVAEIGDLGGEACANTEDAGTWEGSRRLVGAALEAFGDLHVVVNNAGILRDRFIVNMTEEEWDSVLDVHLKAPFMMLRHAGAYWKGQSAEGRRVRAAVVNTSSTSGLVGNPGQANYGSAKAGVAALTVIAAAEMARFGVRVNAVAPAARTRLTESAPGMGDIVAPPADPGRFDEWDPGNVSPLVAWLATEGCRETGRVFFAFGGTIAPMSGWSRSQGISRPRRWTIADIEAELPAFLDS